MSNRRIFTILTLLAVISAGGCEPGSALSGMFSPRGKKQTRTAGELQLNRDSIPMMGQGQVGIDTNQHERIEEFAPPETIAERLANSGYKGISQHTFAETGGDIHVNVDETGKKLIFATSRYSKTHQICTQSTTGRAVTLVTEDRMSDMMPKISQKGATGQQFIAWASNRSGNMDILVQSVNSSPNSRPEQLTRSTDDDIHPAWSPLIPGAKSPKLLAFSRFNSMDGQWQIWVVDYNLRIFSSITTGLFPEFSPVTKKDRQGNTIYTIAYQRSRKRDVPWYSIWTIDLRIGKTGAVEMVGAPREIIASDRWAAITPAWSPDGKYITFATVRKSPLTQFQSRVYKADDVWVVRTDGTNLTQITSHSAPDWDPWWAIDPSDPTGPGRIYFVSERSGHANIWSVKPLIAGLVARMPTMKMK